MTDRDCEADVIAATDDDYDKKRARAKAVAREKFLAAAFLLGAYRRQYRGMMTQL